MGGTSLAERGGANCGLVEMANPQKSRFSIGQKERCEQTRAAFEGVAQDQVGHRRGGVQDERDQGWQIAQRLTMRWALSRVRQWFADS
jgi:hypothetical protein